MPDSQKPKKERKSSKTKPNTICTPISKEKDELIFAVCERFFEQLCPRDSQNAPATTKTRRKGAASAVAEWLANERDRPDLNREKIYPLLWEALRRGFLLLQAPIEKELRDGLIEKYDLQQYIDSCNGEVIVTNVVGPTAPKDVNTRAADLIVDLIVDIYKLKKSIAISNGQDSSKVRVHIGFGAGYAAMEVAKRLSTRGNIELPKLTLHAISPGGYYLAEQHKDTSTYFSYFVERSLDVECVGLFSTPVVIKESFESFKKNPSLRCCFERRDEIDIVVTSLASSSDEHGLMRDYFEYLKKHNFIGEDVIQTLNAQGWVGDLLFQPYSSTNPIYPDSLRTVALFNFEELLQFSRTPGKHVVLCGAPCAECGKPKTEALRPLLSNPSLRAWTHLVLDREAANQLLKKSN